jgi:hypothetical protein
MIATSGKCGEGRKILTRAAGNRGKPGKPSPTWSAY